MSFFSKTNLADRTHMPAWVYLSIMLLALALGTGALYVNREYALANLLLLKLDERSMMVRSFSVNLLLTSYVAMFFVSAMIPRQKFGFLRWKLWLLGLAIWTFDCAAMYQARFGIALSGQSTALATTQHAADLRASIDSLRATAKGLRESAARQASSKFPESRADGAASLRRAADADQRARALSAELAQVSHAKAPAEAEVWHEYMPYKAFAESLLISLVSWVAYGLAGEMVRASRDAHAADSAARPAPAVQQSKADAPLPSWTASMSKPTPAFAAAAVPLGAVAAPAPYAPPVPTPPSISVPSMFKAPPATVLTQAHPAHETVLTQAQSPSSATAAQAPATVLAQAHQAAQTVLAQAQSPAEPSTVKRAKAKAQRTAVEAGRKMDTGTEGKAAARYQRVKAAVVAGRMKPSVRGIQAEEGGGTKVARSYLQQLAAEGLIEPKGQGWALVTADKSQLSLQGV